MVKRFGYWVFGKDMNNVKLETLQKNGVTDIFLNYYAFTTHGKAKVINWIKKAKKYGIHTHIWVQCFYDGAWVNPVGMDLTKKRKEIKNYANVEGVYGIHLDYLRYPGNAYKTTNSVKTITDFVKKVRSDNPKTVLSCALMPETSDNKKYYGQDVDALGKIVDILIPMQYKGNYSAGTSWLKSTSQYFSKRGKLWSGLQSYKSDDDTTILSNKELLTDVKNCFSGGATGVVLFRYGLAPSLNLTSYTQKSTTTTTTTAKSTTQYISSDDIKKMSSSIKAYVEKNKKIPSKIKINNKEYTYGQMAFILAYAIIKPNTKSPVITVKNAVKPTGDKVNEKLTRDDYLDVAKRLYKYIKTNKRCPNYATTKKSKKKLHPKVFVYALAKIVNYYYAKGKNASAVTVSYKHFQTTTKTTTANKTVTTKKVSLHSYLTDEGCAGMGQCTGYYCGPNSLQQCFYRLTGIHVSESTIAGVAGTTTDGTDHDGLNTAVAWFNKKYNKNVKITWKNFSDLGSSSSARWSALQSYINKGAVFCHLLYRDQWGHYEVPKGVGDDYLSILNSLGDYYNYPSYCGYIETRSKSAQLSYINGISQKSIAILTNG